MSDSISSDILEIFRNQLDLEKSKVTLDTPLASVGVDSLKMVEIIYDLEERFDISIPDPDLVSEKRQFETTADVVRVVKELIEQQGKTP